MSCYRLRNIRISPLINKIPIGAFFGCENLFGVELPEGINRIGKWAFSKCWSLRNLSLPPSADIVEEAFDGCRDLLDLFGSRERINEALRHRFDKLPIHKLIYYQSYHPTEATRNKLSMNMKTRTGKSGNQQDSLGMTPLHILACSKKQSLELYQLILEKHPTNLITEDVWGGTTRALCCVGRDTGGDYSTFD
jgi:hypothetical protein